MSSPEGPLLQVFYTSSTIACIGFLLLLAQPLLAARRHRANLNSYGTSPAETPEDEAQKPVGPSSNPPGAGHADSGGESEAEPRAAGTRPLHDKVDALRSQLRAAGDRDTTDEITSAVCTYLWAAEILLRVHRGKGRLTASSAGIIVQQATAETASLRALGPGPNKNNFAVFATLFTGTLSVLAVWTAVATFALPAKVVMATNGGQAATTLVDLMLRGEILMALFYPAALQAAALHWAVVVPDELLFRLALAHPAIFGLSCALYTSLLLEVPKRALGLGLLSSTVLIIWTTLTAAFSTQFACERLSDIDESDAEV